MVDDPTPEDDPIDAAENLVKRFGDEVDARMNKILDERLRVNEPPKEDPEADPEADPKKEGDPEDPPPAPKSLAEKLGF